MNNLEIEKEKELEKKANILRREEASIHYRIPLVPITILFVILTNIFLRPYPTSYIVAILLVSLSLAAFPLHYFIKKKINSFSSKAISFFFVLYIILEITLISIFFYLWKPILTYYIGGGTIFILGLVLVIYLIGANPIFNSRGYSYFFFSLVCLIIVIFVLLEYFGIYPVYPNYMVEGFYHTGQIIPLVLSVLMVITMMSILQMRLGTFWVMLRKQASELKELNKDLDQKVNERTMALREAKTELEMRVNERTRELNTKVDELEKFRKLSVGRELKMIELKNALKESDQKIAELKKKIEGLEEGV